MSLRAEPRPQDGQRVASPFDHLFLAFVIETAGAEDSGRFEDLWRGAERSFATLVVREGRLLILVIARSSVEGLEPLESDASLQRFDAPGRQILVTTGRR